MGLAQVNIRFAANLREFSSQLQTIQRDFAKVGSQMQSVGQSMTLGITAPLLAIGVAAYSMAADFEDALGATNQIFKDASDSTKQWANSLPSYYGIAKKEGLEYSNMMGSMLKNIGGLTEQQASAQSAKLIELAGDLTAMYGGTTADAVRALTGSLKGNNTMLDNYGMAVNDAMVKTKAYEMGLIKQGETLTLSAKQAATLALIYEQTGAAQGQASREADGASGSFRAFKTEIANLTTEFGQHLLPVITPVMQKLRDMIAGFRELDPEVKKTIIVIAGIAAAAGPLIAAFGTFAAILPSIIAGIGSMGTAFAVLSGPIGWVIIAIGAIIALMVKNWSSVKKTILQTANYFIDLYNESMLVRAGIEYIILAFKNMYGAIKFVFGLASSALGNFWNQMKTVGKGIGSIFKAIITGDITSIPKILADAFSVSFSGIKDTLNSYKEDFNQFIGGVKSNIGSAFDGIKTNKYSLLAENVDTVPVTDKIENDVTVATESGINAGIDNANNNGKTLKVKAIEVKSIAPVDLNYGGSQNYYDEQIQGLKNLRDAAYLGGAEWTKLNNQIKDIEVKVKAQVDAASFENAKVAMTNIPYVYDAVSADIQQKQAQFTENMNGMYKGLSDGLVGAFESISSGLISNMGEAETGMQRFEQAMLQTIIKVMAMAMSSALASAIQGGSASGAATGPGAIVAMPTMIATLVAGVIGAFAAIPKFANGGIVSGPTLGLMGEYAGATNNPEVIAPLNKLKELIEPANGANNVTVQLAGGWRISGNDLITVINRSETLNKRKR